MNCAYVASLTVARPGSDNRVVVEIISRPVAFGAFDHTRAVRVDRAYVERICREKLAEYSADDGWFRHTATIMELDTGDTWQITIDGRDESDLDCQSDCSLRVCGKQ